jgi:hypothetical protein
MPVTLTSFAAWAIRSTHHTVLKASPGAAIFGQDMLFDILFIADWKKIGEHRQKPTDLNTARENKGRIDYDYKVCMAESPLDNHNSPYKWNNHDSARKQRRKIKHQESKTVRRIDNKLT